MASSSHPFLTGMKRVFFGFLFGTFLVAWLSGEHVVLRRLVTVDDALLRAPALRRRHHGEEQAQQVLKRYMSMHSVQQLKLECPSSARGNYSIACPGLCHRKFAVAFYACPFQAGNRLHHFLTSMAWAIATNRTLLYKYYDYETCKMVGKGHDGRICSRTGTHESCQEVLELAEWIPSYDEWSFVAGNWSKVSYWSTHSPPTTNQTIKRHAWHEGDYKYAGIDTDERITLDFGQLLGQDFRDLWFPHTRDYLLHTHEARYTAHELLKEDNIMLSGDYLYGMLFHAAFSFSDKLLSSTHSVPLVEHETTIAIHSRHTNTRDYGKDVIKEVLCLQTMLRNVQQPCRVFVMSDRSATVERLSLAAIKMGCNVSSVNHSKFKMERSFSVEHGPFAGAGLFLDLALASQARHGLVGTRRSSTMLLAELITFARVSHESLRDDSRPYVFCDYERDCKCTTVIEGVD